MFWCRRGVRGASDSSQNTCVYLCRNSVTIWIGFMLIAGPWAPHCGRIRPSRRTCLGGGWPMSAPSRLPYITGLQRCSNVSQLARAAGLDPAEQGPSLQFSSSAGRLFSPSRADNLIQSDYHKFGPGFARTRRRRRLSPLSCSLTGGRRRRAAPASPRSSLLGLQLVPGEG